MDPYVYPGTSVLRNLAGLDDPDRLSEREAQTSTLRLAQLAALRIEGAYDLAHLQEFHRFVFQDVYPWAGELRSVPLAKPGSMFALPEHIDNYMSDVLRQLAGESHLRGLPRDQFAERLTHYYAEINAVHPFREGNGRAQRAFSAPASRGRRPHTHMGAVGSSGARARLAAKFPGRRPANASPDRGSPGSP